MCPFLLGGAGVEPPTKFSKSGGGGGLGKEGVVFSNKNKLKSEISNHKKSL